MKDNIGRFLTDRNTPIKEAIKKLDAAAEKILFITGDDGALFGALADGDIRRWLLKDGDFNSSVSTICNRIPISIRENHTGEDLRRLFLSVRVDCIPVVDRDNRVIELVFWRDVFGARAEGKKAGSVSIPAVIMAGGKGTRLDPFTKILPKPLIPIGDRPILEHIIEKFQKYGVNRFLLTINYKSKIIKAYFEEEVKPEYRVEFIEEEKPLGTAGGLKFMEKSGDEVFFVCNCDTIIDADYDEMLRFHLEKGNDLTIVAALKNYNIPYGICEIESGGKLIAIREKPEYNFLVNTGMYVISKRALEFVLENEFLNITELIFRIKEKNNSVGVFPISGNSWIDIGEWDEYKKVIKKFQHD